jgi:hypothetical protein
MALHASALDRATRQAGRGEVKLLTSCGLSILKLTAAWLFSNYPALAQCSVGIACGAPAAFSPIGRGDLPGQNIVVTSTAVAIEIPITTFGATSNTRSAPTSGTTPHSTPSDVPLEHLMEWNELSSAAAKSGAALLLLQPTIADQAERSSLDHNGSPTTLWNAETILYKLERTGGPCSLNRQGPQINTCR